MAWKRLITLMTFAAMLTGGCSKSEFSVSSLNKKNWPASTRPTGDAKEEPPPKILPATYFAAGQLLERQGRADGAMHQYRKAILVAHEYVAAHHRLGLLLSDAGRHEEALMSLRTAASLAPHSAVVLNNLGYELMLMEQWDEAAAQLAKAVELTPTFARARVNYGMALSKLGRFEEALASFRAVLPEPDAQYNLGLMYRGQQRFEEAAGAFARVLELEPEFSAAQAQLRQMAPRLDQLAWNQPEDSESALADSGMDPNWSAAERGSSQDESGSSGSSVSVSISGSSMGMTILGPESADNPWVTTDVTPRQDGFDHRGSQDASVWASMDVSGPLQIPNLDLSRSSTPPTVEELNAALSVVRNEMECIQSEAFEYGWTPAWEYGYTDAVLGEMYAGTSESSSMDSSSGSTSGTSEHRQRRTMGMTIIPVKSSQSEEESQNSDPTFGKDALESEQGEQPFVGPPAPSEPQSMLWDGPNWIGPETAEVRDFLAEADVQRLLNLLDVVSNETNCWDQLSREQVASAAVEWSAADDATGIQRAGDDVMRLVATTVVGETDRAETERTAGLHPQPE